jgi:D-glycero-D-manno-heptose 1,7-bisphosphate phosphatase
MSSPAPPPASRERATAGDPAPYRASLEKGFGEGAEPLTRGRVSSPRPSGRGSTESFPLRKAVFLDRDGVINEPVVREGKPYPPASLAEWKLLPGVPEACHRLRAAGYLLVVVTNQPDVGRGTQRQEEVEAIHRRMCAELPLDRVEVCYHPGRGETCACRKPAPGMLLCAAEALGIDLRESFMVGDRWRDVDAGAAAGCRTIFVDRGYREDLRAQPDFRARDLAEASELILAAFLSKYVD